MDKEQIYLKLPIPLQNLACNIEGYRIKRSRYDSTFMSRLAKANKRTYSSREDLFGYRDAQIRKFIFHCYETVPYYKHLFDERRVKPEYIKGLDDLKILPILTKDEVKANYKDLLSTAVPENKHLISHTSGTTGGGLRFATTLESQQEQWVTWWRYRNWHGIALETWCAYFGGRSLVPLSQKATPFWRINYPGKQIMFSAYHMNNENMTHYVKYLNQKQPKWLHGYPSLLSLLAGYVLETGKKLNYQVKWITIGAENLLEQQKDLIKEAFGVYPIQHYGMAEGAANISQCEKGNLHVDEDYAAIEFEPNTEGSGFKVIGTNFTNYAFPLLRYDTQDLVNIEDGTSCFCGRHGRIVKTIDGRKEDYVVLRDGTRIGRMDHIFKDLVNINEAQIYQQIPGKIEVRIVKGKEYNASDEKKLHLEIEKRLGKDTQIDFSYVEKLERSKTGKLRFVINEIKAHKIDSDFQE